MKILLISDETHKLAKINELFQGQGCKTALVNDALVALKLLSKHNFDVVLVGQQLQKTSNINFLKAVTIKFPNSVRIALADNNNGLAKENEVNSLSHYVFDQPIDTAQLLSTVLSLAESQKAITNKGIVELVSKIKALPSPPKVFLQLNNLLKKDHSDSTKFADIIGQDPSLTAKVLQFSNNNFIKNGKQLTNINDAITKMGVDTLSCIVMTAELFSSQVNIAKFSLKEEQLNSLSTARLAASLVSDELKQDALLAGLLHAIGKLILFEIDRNFTLKYFENSARATDDLALEQRFFSTNHCQIGGYLLHLWGFPYHIINAVLWHRAPEKLLANQFGIAQANYLSYCLLKEEDPCTEFISHFNLTEDLTNLKMKALRYKCY
jgi:HD-like signal output (HDOD) protein